MYKLTKENKELLIERSILKSNELNLFYNTSLGIQAYTQHMGLNGGKPKYIFDVSLFSGISVPAKTCLNWFKPLIFF